MIIQFENFNHIVADPSFCDGQPRINGTRITVAAILSYLGGGMSVDSILSEFPKLQREQIYQAISFAALNFRDRYIPIIRAKSAA